MGNMAEHPEAIEKQLVLQFFGHRREGFFIEVGANDPKGGSQTWLLEQKGWRGTATLHLAVHDGFSTLQPQVDSHGIEFSGTETVDLMTLDDILAKENNPKVDFISIDVEAQELQVLSGFSLERHQPALVLIEDGVRNLDKHRHMTGRGYKLVKRTVLNNWYVPRETKFTMVTVGERLELLRKMYLATPIRQWRLAMRRRKGRA